MAKDDFDKGVEYVQSLPASGPVKLSNSQKLTLYGYYKVGSAGPCTVSAPSRLQVVARAKWEAWNKLGNTLTKDQARSKYLAELDRLSPGWRNPASRL